MKMKSENVVGMVVTVGSATTGSFVSKIVADKLSGTIKKPIVKHGLVALASIAGALMLDRKDETQALLQDFAFGGAVAQANDVLKQIVAKEEGVIKSPILRAGLNSPEEFLAGDYDFIPSNIQEIIEEENIEEELPQILEFRG